MYESGSLKFNNADTPTGMALSEDTAQLSEKLPSTGGELGLSCTWNILRYTSCILASAGINAVCRYHSLGLIMSAGNISFISLQNMPSLEYWRNTDSFVAVVPYLPGAVCHMSTLFEFNI